MAVQRGSAVASGDFREAVCIDGGRVYDSCCDRDCLEDLRVYFAPAGQTLIENAASVQVGSGKQRLYGHRACAP